MRSKSKKQTKNRSSIKEKNSANSTIKLVTTEGSDMLSFGYFKGEKLSSFGLQKVQGSSFTGQFSGSGYNGLFRFCSPKEQYLGYLKEGDYEGVGTLQSPNAIRQGRFLNGSLNGYANTIDFQIRESYKGFFKFGLFHGDGVLKRRTFIHNGNFCLGEANGFGIQYIEDNSLIIGNWNKVSTEGFTIISYSDESLFEGNLTGGRKEGPGHYSSTTGDQIFIGEYSNNQRNGIGAIKFGRYYYIGQWRADSKHGLGISGEINCQDFYIGSFRKDQKTGLGALFKGSRQYLGYWKNGFLDGITHVKDRHGFESFSLFENGEFVRSLRQDEIQQANKIFSEFTPYLIIEEIFHSVHEINEEILFNRKGFLELCRRFPFKFQLEEELLEKELASTASQFLDLELLIKKMYHAFKESDPSSPIIFELLPGSSSGNYPVSPILQNREGMALVRKTELDRKLIDSISRKSEPNIKPVSVKIAEVNSSYKADQEESVNLELQASNRKIIEKEERIDRRRNSIDLLSDDVEGHEDRIIKTCSQLTQKKALNSRINSRIDDKKLALINTWKAIEEKETKKASGLLFKKSLIISFLRTKLSNLLHIKKTIELEEILQEKRFQLSNLRRRTSEIKAVGGDSIDYPKYEELFNAKQKQQMLKLKMSQDIRELSIEQEDLIDFISDQQERRYRIKELQEKCDNLDREYDEEVLRMKKFEIRDDSISTSIYNISKEIEVPAKELFKVSVEASRSNYELLSLSQELASAKKSQVYLNSYKFTKESVDVEQLKNRLNSRRNELEDLRAKLVDSKAREIQDAGTQMPNYSENDTISLEPGEELAKLRNFAKRQISLVFGTAAVRKRQSIAILEGKQYQIIFSTLKDWIDRFFDSSKSFRNVAEDDEIELTPIFTLDEEEKAKIFSEMIVRLLNKAIHLKEEADVIESAEKDLSQNSRLLRFKLSSIVRNTLQINGIISKFGEGRSEKLTAPTDNPKSNNPSSLGSSIDDREEKIEEPIIPTHNIDSELDYLRLKKEELQKKLSEMKIKKRKEQKQMSRLIKRFSYQETRLFFDMFRISKFTEKFNLANLIEIPKQGKFCFVAALDGVRIMKMNQRTGSLSYLRTIGIKNISELKTTSKYVFIHYGNTNNLLVLNKKMERVKEFNGLPNSFAGIIFC